MSRFQKIFLASTLVIVGFGVAKFLGQPVPGTQTTPSTAPIGFTTPTATSSVNVPVGGLRTPESVRLTPDISAAFADIAVSSTSSSIPEPPALGTNLGPIMSVSRVTDVPTELRAENMIANVASPPGESFASRATLRNEAPRAVGVDPRSPAVIRRLPVSGGTDGAANGTVAAPASPTSIQSPQPLNAAPWGIGKSLPTAIATSYDAPTENSENGQPKSFPVADADSTERRTHIVIDGDTLERLAGRYLADPQRSRELYEFNRDVLTSPDLLPIGVELKIPDRMASATADQWKSGSNSTASPQMIIPRAQLARPMVVQ